MSFHACSEWLTAALLFSASVPALGAADPATLMNVSWENFDGGPFDRICAKTGR